MCGKAQQGKPCSYINGAKAPTPKIRKPTNGRASPPLRAILPYTLSPLLSYESNRGDLRPPIFVAGYGTKDYFTRPLKQTTRKPKGLPYLTRTRKRTTRASPTPSVEISQRRPLISEPGGTEPQGCQMPSASIYDQVSAGNVSIDKKKSGT